MALYRYLDMFDPELAAAYAQDSRLGLKGADEG